MIVDYYEILEVWPSSSTEDIKKSYFRLAKIYHPDIAGNTPENRDRFKLINEAYNTLSNSSKRQEYDESLMKGKHKNKSANVLKEQDKRSASLAYMQAKKAAKDGRFEKSVLLLKSAIKYDPSNPAYHSLYGLSLAMTNAQLHEARDACKKALQMEFYNPDYHANLGFVYFKAGLKNLAVKHFKDALKWDSDNYIAKKYMALMESKVANEVGPIDKMISSIKNIFAKAV